MSQKIKLVIYIALFFPLASTAFSQNYYNAPYTRYKIGDMLDNGFSYNNALGGSSTALRPKNQINYLNPASLTTQDTNSFLFQVGFTGRNALVENIENQDQSTNFNISYIALGFPVGKWLNMSLGVTPYSRIQYFLREESDETAVGESLSKDIKGFGGFNEFYLGTGMEIKDFASVGVHFGYLFGSLDRSTEVYLTDLPNSSALIQHTQNYIAGDFYTKFGLQFYPKFNDHQLIIGATFEPETDINVKLKGNTLRLHTASGASFVDSLSFNVDTIAPLLLPKKYSIGLTYIYKDALTVTAEMTHQDWSGTNIDNSKFKPGIYSSFRFGLEFYPASLKVNKRLNYTDRIRYRIGANTTKSYLYYDDKNIGSWSISAGLGLPIKNARKVFSGTTLNLGYTYGQKGTTDNGLIKENLHIITFGLTLHDYWFLKPKYD